VAHIGRHPVVDRVPLPRSALTGLPKQEGSWGKANRSNASSLVGCPSGHSKSPEGPKLFAFVDGVLTGRDVAVADAGVRPGADAVLPGAITMATTRHTAITSPANSRWSAFRGGRCGGREIACARLTGRRRSRASSAHLTSIVPGRWSSRTSIPLKALYCVVIVIGDLPLLVVLTFVERCRWQELLALVTSQC
jgi:hypothetical protein